MGHPDHSYISREKLSSSASQGAVTYRNRARRILRAQAAPAPSGSHAPANPERQRHLPPAGRVSREHQRRLPPAGRVSREQHIKTSPFHGRPLISEQFPPLAKTSVHVDTISWFSTKSGQKEYRCRHFSIPLITVRPNEAHHRLHQKTFHLIRSSSLQAGRDKVELFQSSCRLYCPTDSYQADKMSTSTHVLATKPRFERKSVDMDALLDHKTVKPSKGGITEQRWRRQAAP